MTFRPNLGLIGCDCTVYDDNQQLLCAGQLTEIRSMFDYVVDGRVFSIGSTNCMTVEDGLVMLSPAWEVLP